MIKLDYTIAAKLPERYESNEIEKITWTGREPRDRIKPISSLAYHYPPLFSNIFSLTYKASTVATILISSVRANFPLGATSRALASHSQHGQQFSQLE
jgi:hypothetical protein